MRLKRNPYRSSSVLRAKTLVVGASVTNIGTTTVTLGSGTTINTYYFTLLDAGVSTYSSIYDYYKIRKIKIHYENITGVGNQTQTEPGLASSSCPPAWIVTNFDGAVPASEVDFIEKYGAKKVSIVRGQNISCIFRPRALMGTQTAAGTNVFATMKVSPWLDSTSTDIRHYGVSVLLPGQPANGAKFTFKIYVSFYLSFKQRQ